VFSLQFSAVQTFVSKKIMAYLSAELDSEITIDRVYFKPFSSLELTNFKLKDHQGQTLLAAESF
jgi:hypothetical protein